LRSIKVSTYKFWRGHKIANAVQSFYHIIGQQLTLRERNGIFLLSVDFLATWRSRGTGKRENHFFLLGYGFFAVVF
jgi:hypothetical protein